MIAVVGENFYESQEDENLDKTTKLEREVRLLKYKSETSELDSAISSYVSQNKTIITSDADEKKLRDELKYVSGELPVKERISRAAAMAFGSLPNTTSVYKEIAV